MVAILVIAGGLVGAGTVVELSRFGDQEEISSPADAEALFEAAKFRRLAQYDSILLQRKSPSARMLLPFSILRNGVHLNINQRGFRTAVQNEEKDAAIKPDQRVAKYLKVMNGLKGSAMLLMIWGTTYFFSWFSVVSNPNDL